MKRYEIVAVLMLALAAGVVHAQGPSESAQEESAKAAFEAQLGYQTGTVTLKGGMATIRLPESFRFIGPEGSRLLLTEAWGNPPGSADDVLGMLIPSELSPLSDEGWGVVITYDEDGYVDDKDAAEMDYTKLLKEMQEATVETNEERKKQGFEAVTLVGWAEPPSYDQAAHKMYWAKDLVFGDEGEHTLNYNIRILGRRGVLVLNAVSDMDRLASIRGESQNLLAAVEFNEGHRYTDFLPGKDKAATYGLAGLVVGATAAKAGFFKMLWLGLLAFKKAILVAVLAAAAAAKRFFGGAEKAA
jgi:uncharacterized membrane-anchored protein